MALRYAVLGLLTKEELSGYDLAQRFGDTVSHFWHAHHTQIYRELQKLEADGLVEHQRIEQQERPDKKVYRITEEGMEALMLWLGESPKPPKMKNESLLRVSLFHLIPPERAIAFLEESRTGHEHARRQMEAWREAHFPEKERSEDSLIPEFLTLEFGLRFVTTWIEWCDYAIGLFAKRKASDETTEI